MDAEHAVNLERAVNPERAERFPRSLRNVADLARAGGQGASNRFARTRFEIHHVVDRPGYYRALLEGEMSGSQQFDFVETLTSAANGVGLIVGTALDPSGTSVRVADASPRARVAVAEPQRRVLHGEAQPNPSFLYESYTALEGIIAIEQEPIALAWRHGAAIAEAALEVAAAAAEALAPILTLQCPVQIPAHRFTGDGSPAARHHDWPRSSAIAVRFAIAVGEITAAERVPILRRLVAYCAPRGFGLWVNDTRPDHRSGNWFQVLRHQKELARRALRIHAPGKDLNSPWVLPVTFVGPARVDSTHAALSLLHGFRPVSILATSVTSLDDLSFVHVQLGIPARSREDYVRSERRLNALRSSLEDASFGVQLHHTLAAVGIEEAALSPTAIEATAIEQTAGYQLLAGPPLRRTNDHQVARRPIWLSWEMGVEQAGLRLPVTSFFVAVDEWLGEAGGQHHRSLYPNVEYLHSRDTRTGAVSAKAKIAVPDALLETMMPGTDRSTRGVRLSALLEELWVAALEGTAARPRELTVAWREYWLRRWSSISG